MNIQEAKEQIKNAMTAYFTKDSFGRYVIGTASQRPVFLMGPPGIGKTAVMAQIAAELGVGLVSYSMTHHTRQSALGLPFIVTKTYAGKEYQVSEYTMSEIIASVYDLMEESGIEEGILFLDEINCVSETLAPSMLQFLQYKTFGRHRVPEGWIVVTAGNPPEYNSSAREFDIVTWDRLKRIDIEPDYDAWKEYAGKKGVHPAIITYLDIKRNHFYKVETTVDGKSFVTARGWSDLSDMIRLYEQHGLPINEKLVSQYLQNGKIAGDFALYYDLWNKYRSDYQVDTILAGKASEEIEQRAKNARFDERLALLGLLLDRVTDILKKVYLSDSAQKELMDALRSVRQELLGCRSDFAAIVRKQAARLKRKTESKLKASSMTSDEEYACRSVMAALDEMAVILDEEKPSDGAAAFALLKGAFDRCTEQRRLLAETAGRQLSNVFVFCERVFGEGQEILILVTELTINFYGACFIGRYGCKEYFAHNKELLFYERQKEIIQKIEDLETEI